MSENSICTLHETRDADIAQIKESTDRHSGQWKILLWCLGIFTTSIIGMSAMHYQNQQDLTIQLTQLNLTMSNYIHAHTIESKTGFELIRKNEAHIEDHEQRLRIIERDFSK